MTLPRSGSRLVPFLAPAAFPVAAMAETQAHAPVAPAEPGTAPSGASRQTTVIVGLIVLLLMVVLVVLGTKKQK